MNQTVRLRPDTLRAWALCLVLCLMAGCVGLPAHHQRTHSTADLDTGDTRLGRAIRPLVMAHTGMSGVYPLGDARDAFAARAMLAQAADRTLDVQYYIWRNDMTGSLLFTALRQAADRGVRVRLLLDDNNTSGLDGALAAIDAHPNIEVRLFNPFVIRGMRVFGFLTDFARLNRRMHNKSFTADSQVTVVGGRNVGDEYFGADGDVLFADLDVLAVGPVVTEVAHDFDRYWNSKSSYPADRILPAADDAAAATLSAAALQLASSARAQSYASAVHSTAFHHDLLNGTLAMEWAVTRMVSDDPAKGLGLARRGTLIFDKIRKMMGEPATELNLVSPYFVPTGAGVEAFVALAKKGVKIRVLTNALEATDVAAVHSGYAKHRKPLLEAGISLYELRRLSPVSTARSDTGMSGSSASSLHSKTFSVDRSRVFIGSFNFDPRSAKLNTEMGFVIDSPTLAGRISRAFEQRIPAQAYEVRLSADGQLYWQERRGSATVRHEVEPGTSFGQRAAVWFMSLLPVDWLL
ncbi:phospholipase D family protein [Massilia sp. GCM10020059]|nr:phospholipase D-like domain-containing protein [Massilia agrisoli]